uniref:Uncharacterized protein n=1 Tax=Anguilla anguilla TaxID=7936 RepID=A0A0E9V1Y3_ANGAN
MLFMINIKTLIQQELY